MESLSNFQQLDTWKQAHQLVLAIYRATRSHPADERFGLVQQMRRAAVSVPANVAEGFKRQVIQDKLRFYNISEGSLEELKYYLILSRDLEYTSAELDIQLT
ncbi:MAG: four helix bundle protein, partial [Caldilineales bacterium]|nr:four helix bundle protein [Caldilineales bacterium]